MPVTPQQICRNFRTKNPAVSVIPVTTGHINDTYFVSTHSSGAPSFVLQRINRSVFKDIPGLMLNIVKVLKHIEGRITADDDSSGFYPLRLIPDMHGNPVHIDNDGQYWRMYNHIPGSCSFDLATDPQLAKEAGRAYGVFQQLTQDLDSGSLVETIPDFHNIATRLETFYTTIGKDPAGRIHETREDIRFVEQRASGMHVILELGAAGKIPLRVTHNDTKFNNVLFNTEGRAICIADLDTVMPGYSLYDFGDAIRTGASSSAEDEEDLSKVGLNMELFRAYADGYLSATRTFLLPDEISRLAFSARFMTFIIGLRFLTDYIDGDHYFRIRHEKHNLVRARAQFRLLLKMEEQSETMEKIISTFA